ncbi:VF530 family DNA-binding protein [Aliiglaciecola sp. CAU 1673]|uniref:VF530 family protein n=1 Tax=Aliiglaciecola sp. CAU 1673 TaxID=3032595 RepID=UPI0023DC0FC7|nr:VF530 family DNA-binding protein [Aliiglaciecola sp. CAU 1673]MDF2178799.1 VF530 family DNA-binding protein [Aliiglaciecola sp. CAU 1673]
MNDDINYKNNPLHGLSLKQLLTEIVDHYGFEILFAYLNINCFKTNPSIDSSVKFLKKTDWAREKVEAFYLYQFKSLPRASASQFELPPRDRVIPDDQVPGEPAELSLEDAERLREKRAAKAAAFGRGDKPRGNKSAGSWAPSPSRNQAARSSEGGDDPWAKWKK